MTVSTATIQKRLAAFAKKWDEAVPFSRVDMAASLQIPIGTASALCSQAAALGLLTHDNCRPRKYSFPKKAALKADIDELLSIVAEIDSKGVKRSTIAPLLSWAANALLTA